MGKPCPGSLLPPMGKPCPGSLPPPMGKPKSGNLLLWENLITQGFPIGGMSLPILDRGSIFDSVRKTLQAIQAFCQTETTGMIVLG